MGLDTPDGALELGMRLALALGCGLLIGVERERRKGSGPRRHFAGVRTFALTALLGGMVQSLAMPALTTIAALFVAAIGALAWIRTAGEDPGATTEIALFLTFVLGAWSMHEPAVAAAAAVVIASMLAARNALRHFSTEVLSEPEYRSVLVLAAAVLIVLPVLPREPVAVLGGWRPHAIWALVVAIMLIQTLGHVALRLFGARWGHGLAGFAAGFVSSTATVAALGARARTEPARLRASVAGALLSSVATFVQIGVIATVIQPGLIARLGPVLVGPILVTAALGAWWAWRVADEPATAERPAMHSLRQAALLALALSACTAIVRWIEQALGPQGVWWAALLAGFADAHAPSAALLTLAAEAPQRWPELLRAVLLVLSANTAFKCGLAFYSGGGRYGWATTVGLVAGLAAAWLSLAWS